MLPVATHLQTIAIMITIRSSTISSEPTLIGLEATLTTLHSAYTISSNGTMADSGSPFGGGLFGAMSWPRSRFQLAPGVVLEQQMFLPHDGSAAAFSWQLHSQSPVQARLAIRPFFSGCGPRSYRDLGFRFASEDDGGRLTWLPSVRGPKIIADTNGKYRDEPMRSIDCFCPQAMESDSSADLITPGTFEFELSQHPSVLIFSTEGSAKTQRDEHIGTFLASLMPSDRSPDPTSVGRGPAPEETACLVEAA